MRPFWRTIGPLETDYEWWSNPTPETDRYETVDELEATLIGSRLESGKHMPVIDLDFPCRLVESSTPGHFHLYLDRPISWDSYRLMLLAMTEAGLVERGYYNASVARGQTFVRKPGVTK